MPFLKKITATHQRRLVCAAAAICLCLALAALIGSAGKIPEGVSAGGVELGGMTKRDARRTLHAAVEGTILTRPLTVSLPKETITLEPGEIVQKVLVRDAVRDAYRSGKAPGAPEIGLLNYLKLDEDAIRTKLEDYAAKYDTELSQYEYHLEGNMPELSTDRFDPDAPCQTLAITLGVSKVKLDVDATMELIRTAYADALTCDAKHYRVTVAKILPEEYADVPDLDAILEELHRDPVDDSLDMDTHEMVPGSYGYTFHRRDAGYAITMADPGETVRIPMEYIEPEILGEKVFFRDVLGSCDTKHSNNENRNTNLRLLCQALNDVVLMPGEEFSYNETVGERTAEKGYKPAPAYSGNRLTDSIGGGVCQGSTTLYNCVLLADLEVIFRACHGAAVSYVPMGLDAAVNWATTDFQFRNSSNFPIKIQAEVSDGYVRMKILGTDEKDYYIVMTSSYDDSDEKVTYAVSYKNKYSKATGELLSKEREAFSAYYHLG